MDNKFFIDILGELINKTNNAVNRIEDEDHIEVSLTEKNNINEAYDHVVKLIKERDLKQEELRNIEHIEEKKEYKKKLTVELSDNDIKKFEEVKELLNKYEFYKKYHHSNKATNSQTVSFLINYFYLTTFINLKLDNKTESKKDFLNWTLEHSFKRKRGNKVLDNLNVHEMMKIILKNQSMLKSIINKNYYLDMNRYLSDKPLVKKDEFLPQGTTNDLSSNIGQLDNELRKAVKEQFRNSKDFRE